MLAWHNKGKFEDVVGGEKRVIVNEYDYGALMTGGDGTAAINYGQVFLGGWAHADVFGGGTALTNGHSKSPKIKTNFQDFMVRNLEPMISNKILIRDYLDNEPEFTINQSADK